MSAIRTTVVEGIVQRRHRWQRKTAPYLFVLPFYLFFGVFLAAPIVSALRLSLSNATGLGEPAFIGLRNFANLFRDEVFFEALANTAWYSAASIFVVVPLGLLLAVLLNSSALRFRRFFRTTFFIPNITAVVVIGIMFILVYDYHYGLVNFLLTYVGLEPLRWLGDDTLAKVSIVGLVIWRWTGFIMVYFLAGLQGIPVELYEAAYVDGANRVQVLLHITIPMLRPVILFVLVVVTIGSFQIFTEPYILTKGGPGNATLSLAQYLYRTGFTYVRYGYASTIGVVLSAIILALSLLQLRLFHVFRED